jgi:predicted RND superfamily exporter protein
MFTTKNLDTIFKTFNKVQEDLVLFVKEQTEANLKALEDIEEINEEMGVVEASIKQAENALDFVKQITGK